LAGLAAPPRGGDDDASMPEKTISASSSVAPPAPLDESVRSGWLLDPAVHYLNHGSFGARREHVLARQMAYRRQLERQPVAFLDRELPELLLGAREIVGGMLGMNPQDFGFVTNATEGVHAVLRSMDLRPGDRLVTTSHVYRAVGKAMRYVARQCGASVIEVPLALPVRDAAEIVDCLARAIAPDASGRAARLLIVDHVSSPSALVLPIEAIIAAAREAGTAVLVDGAHAPGMLPLDIAALAPDWYTANLHKWICAPPGAAFLWAGEAQRAVTHPMVISHYLDEGLSREFGWQGTRDVTAWLTSADAVQEIPRLLGADGWTQVMMHNHRGAIWAGARLAGMLGTSPLSPADGSMIGSMVTVELPVTLAARFGDPAALQKRLLDDVAVEVPIMVIGDRWYVRPSYQVYNDPASYEMLGGRLSELAG